MGQPGRKKAKGTAVKKAKGGSMMKPKPPGMKGGGKVEDPTLPKGKFRVGGEVGKRNRKKIVPDESGGRKKLRPAPNKGARMLPERVRNKMGFMQDGGPVKKSKGGAMMKPPPKMAKGGSMYKKGKKSGPKP
tara:strand:- start:484 stop:879 length:396 start_codon:yes stop_codon:yes gene_type:complete